MEKRKLSTAEIWTMSFGFLGIQMGFAAEFFKFLVPMCTNFHGFG
jgi:hypothetical protein